MNIISKQEFLASVLKLMARHGALTSAEIRHKTRGFRGRKHIPAESVFTLLEEFVQGGFVERCELEGRMKYRTLVMLRLSEPVEKPVSVMEKAARMQSPEMRALIEHARTYKQRI